jgi:hypothetical protein
LTLIARMPEAGAMGGVIRYLDEALGLVRIIAKRGQGERATAR